MIAKWIESANVPAGYVMSARTGEMVFKDAKKSHLVRFDATFQAKSACKSVNGAFGMASGIGRSLRTARVACKKNFLDWQKQSENYFTK